MSRAGVALQGSGAVHPQILADSRGDPTRREDLRASVADNFSKIALDRFERPHAHLQGDRAGDTQSMVATGEGGATLLDKLAL